MTHYLAGHTTGALEPENAIVEPYVAAAASLPVWGAAVLAAAGSGEYVARVNVSTTEDDPTVVGVFVGPLTDAANLYCSAAAGDVVQVLTFGKTKLKVDGTANIAVGDALTHHDAAGLAQLADLDAETGDSVTTAGQNALWKTAFGAFAMALYASTADGDIITAKVYGARGTQT